MKKKIEEPMSKVFQNSLKFNKLDFDKLWRESCMMQILLEVWHSNTMVILASHMRQLASHEVKLASWELVSKKGFLLDFHQISKSNHIQLF